MSIKVVIEKIFSGEQGRKFFQVFYSLGAAIIIVGVLAKLMHWPFRLSNILLYIGFFTETVVFIISAFDRPIREYQWEDVFPELSGNDAQSIFMGNRKSIQLDPVKQSFGISNIISEEDSNVLKGSIKKMVDVVDQLSGIAEIMETVQQCLKQLSAFSEDVKKNSFVVNDSSNILLDFYKSITNYSNRIDQASIGYIQQMENIQRNISKLNIVYETYLKNINSQIDIVNSINFGLKHIKDLFEGSIKDSSTFRNEIEKMIQQLRDLNNIYNRLLNAMTMNLYGIVGNNSSSSQGNNSSTPNL